MLEEELLKHDMFQANSELKALGFGTGKSFLTKGATPDISSSRNSQGSLLVTTHHWPLKASMSLCYQISYGHIWPLFNNICVVVSTDVPHIGPIGNRCPVNIKHTFETMPWILLPESSSISYCMILRGPLGCCISSAAYITIHMPI